MKWQKRIYGSKRKEKKDLRMESELDPERPKAFVRAREGTINLEISR